MGWFRRRRRNTEEVAQQPADATAPAPPEKDPPSTAHVAFGYGPSGAPPPGGEAVRLPGAIVGRTEVVGGQGFVGRGEDGTTGWAPDDRRWGRMFGIPDWPDDD